MGVDLQRNAESLSKKQKKARLCNSVSRESDAPQPSYLVPDRVTGFDQVEELRRLCPGRTWNFVGLHQKVLNQLTGCVALVDRSKRSV